MKFDKFLTLQFVPRSRRRKHTRTVHQIYIGSQGYNHTEVQLHVSKHNLNLKITITSLLSFTSLTLRSNFCLNNLFYVVTLGQLPYVSLLKPLYITKVFYMSNILSMHWKNELHFILLDITLGIDMLKITAVNNLKMLYVSLNIPHDVESQQYNSKTYIQQHTWQQISNKTTFDYSRLGWDPVLLMRYFSQTGYLSCHPTNSVKAPKEQISSRKRQISKNMDNMFVCWCLTTLSAHIGYIVS